MANKGNSTLTEETMEELSKIASHNVWDDIIVYDTYQILIDRGLTHDQTIEVIRYTFNQVELDCFNPNNLFHGESVYDQFLEAGWSHQSIIDLLKQMQESIFTEPYNASDLESEYCSLCSIAGMTADPDRAVKIFNELDEHSISFLSELVDAGAPLDDATQMVTFDKRGLGDFDYHNPDAEDDVVENINPLPEEYRELYRNYRRSGMQVGHAIENTLMSRASYGRQYEYEHSSHPVVYYRLLGQLDPSSALTTYYWWSNLPVEGKDKFTHNQEEKLIKFGELIDILVAMNGVTRL